MRQIKVQRRHRDKTLTQRSLIGVRMRFGTTEVGAAPEVNSATRIDPAIKFFLIWRDVLAHHTDALDRALVEAGNIDVEETASAQWMPYDLLDDLERILCGLRKVGRLRL